MSARAKGGFSHAVLAAGILAFLGACWYGLAVRAGVAERAEANRQKARRIQSLDPEFKTYLEGEVAIGRLLDQREKAGGFDAKAWFAEAARDAGLPEPALETRELPGSLAGRALCEVSATWPDADPGAFQALLEKAESREPPLRLKSAEIKARSGGKAAIKAEFETLR